MLLYHPVCGLTCSREQQQGFYIWKRKNALFLLFWDRLHRSGLDSQSLVYIRAGLCPTEKLCLRY